MNGLAPSSAGNAGPLIHKFHSATNMQNINSPDTDLDRDVLPPNSEDAIALGMEATELNSADSRFYVNIATILISAIIFLAILAWFDFIQTTFYIWLSPDNQTDSVPSATKCWYAIFITIFVLLLTILIYYYARDTIK